MVLGQGDGVVKFDEFFVKKAGSVSNQDLHQNLKQP